MTVFCLYGAPANDPFVRHEVGVRVYDPVLFMDHEGKRIVAGRSLEESTFAEREDVVDEFWSFTDLGYEELLKEAGRSAHEVDAEVALRAVKRLGDADVVVPSTFPLGVAEHLRSNGIDLRIDNESWWLRRRRKNFWEIEGSERAQRASETAMMTAARMLREAEPTAGGELRFEGEILTADLVREAMIAELSSQGADCEEILVQSGDACLAGHELGRGPILPDTSCIIDCYPRDRRSGAYSDMTRTFVPGRPSEELIRLHEHCRRALDVAFESLRPGRDDAFRKVAEYFESQGFPTKLSYSGPGALRDGFFHGLGHGVGLEVHERPLMSTRSEPVREGDLVAVEPGLYFAGVGGVRLEDTVLVTNDGVEHLTEPLSYDLQP